MKKKAGGLDTEPRSAAGRLREYWTTGFQTIPLWWWVFKIDLQSNADSRFSASNKGGLIHRIITVCKWVWFTVSFLCDSQLSRPVCWQATPPGLRYMMSLGSGYTSPVPFPDFDWGGTLHTERKKFVSECCRSWNTSGSLLEPNGVRNRGDPHTGSLSA